MSLNADALAFLEEKGMSLTDVIELARRMEKRGTDPTNATRQARHRAKKSNAVTVTSVTSPALDKENPQTPKEIKPTPLPPVISSEMTAPASVNGHSEKPELKPEHVIEAWNDVAERHGLPVIRKLTGTRQKHLRTFVRNNSIDEVRSALDAIERSGFLRGENDRGWRADFDFLLQPKSFAKLIEGAYDH